MPKPFIPFFCYMSILLFFLEINVSTKIVLSTTDSKSIELSITIATNEVPSPTFLDCQGPLVDK